MTLAEARSRQPDPLRQATWCFVFNDQSEVLLAMKKRGFGEGMWNAPGGKVKPGESVMATAAREMEEETGVIPKNLLEIARISFYFSTKLESSQEVTGFTSDTFEGTPQETEEMSPKWFKFSDIPYAQMWPDDYLWLPLVLAGNYVTGAFLFGDNNEILEYTLDHRPCR